MSLSLNKAIIAGRIASDLELKKTESGISVCSFPVAVQRPKPKDGGESVADFIECTTWRQTAEFVTKFFKKGMPILVYGSIQTRKWKDKDGNNRTGTELVVSEAHFVESKKTQDDESMTPFTPKFEQVTQEEELPF